MDSKNDPASFPPTINSPPPASSNHPPNSISSLPPPSTSLPPPDSGKSSKKKERSRSRSKSHKKKTKSRSRSRSHSKDLKKNKPSDSKEKHKEKNNHHHHTEKGKPSSFPPPSSPPSSSNHPPSSSLPPSSSTPPSSTLPPEDLEKKFKAFEAEIHAIDGVLSKTEKNENKTKKSENPNLSVLYSKRVYLAGVPLEDEPSLLKLKNSLESFLNRKDIGLFLPTSQVGGAPSSQTGGSTSAQEEHYFYIEFETKEETEQAAQVLEKYEVRGRKLRLLGKIENEENYIKKPFPERKREEEKKIEVVTAQNVNTTNTVDQFFASLNPSILQQPYPYQQQSSNPYQAVPSIPTSFPTFDDQSALSLNQQHQYYYQQQYGNYYQYPPATGVGAGVGAGVGVGVGVQDSMSYNTSAVPQYYQTNMGMTQTSNVENTQAQNQFFAENPNFLEIMPKISPEANVFIKNLNPQTTTKDLEAAFRIYGNILSSKIATDSFGNSMGYGYIQFEYKESADQCIAGANGAVFQDMIISVQPFNSKVNKIDGRNNLYIKNLPTYLNDDQLNQKINEIFGKFGTITSSVVKMDRSLNRPFAFVCFENHIYADMAFKALHDKDPFRSGSRLYISWAEKKTERVKRLTELHSSQQGLQQGGYGYYGGYGGYKL